MLMRFSRWVARRPGWCVLGWVGAAAALSLAPGAADAPGGRELSTFLPDDAPTNRAYALLQGAFPESAYRSSIVIVAQRSGGLTAADEAFLGELTRQAGTVQPELIAPAQVLSPWSASRAGPFLRKAMISPDGEVGLIAIGLPGNYLTTRAVEAVEAVEGAAERLDRPAGLRLYFSGSAGGGRDYARHTRAALGRTTWVTIAAVVAFLVLIYRAPLAAAVPLTAVGLSAYVTMRAFDLLAAAGWPVGTGEKIFAVVLVFGTGTDYALFLLARYREALESSVDRRPAIAEALTAVAPALAGGAGTTIAGLAMMVAADFGPSRVAGPALAVALLVTWAAGMTLVPALAGLAGRWLFWPSHGVAGLGRRRVWPALASGVTRRPGLAAVALLLALGIPAGLATRLEFRFDALAGVPPESPSMVGLRVIGEHFGEGQAFPVLVLLHSEHLGEAAGREKLLAAAERRVLASPVVRDVRSLLHPLGTLRPAATQPVGSAGRLLDAAVRRTAAPYYLSRRLPVARMDVTLRTGAFEPAALDGVRQFVAGVEQTLREHDPHARALATGATPYIADVRSVSRRDQWVVTALVVGVILAIVMVLLREIALPVAMVAGTLLTYAATLGICEPLVGLLWGHAGLDWKIRLILLVIIVAVGQDYNIFVVTRLRQEQRGDGSGTAIARAMVATGSVISGCGLIMAATLGSLAATRMPVLQQTGLALAVGMLIDTFMVRTVLVPACAAWLSGRRRRARKSRLNAAR